MFKAEQGGALSNLLWWKEPLPRQEGRNLIIFKVPSNPDHSMKCVCENKSGRLSHNICNSICLLNLVPCPSDYCFTLMIIRPASVWTLQKKNPFCNCSWTSITKLKKKKNSKLGKKLKQVLHQNTEMRCKLCISWKPPNGWFQAEGPEKFVRCLSTGQSSDFEEYLWDHASLSSPLLRGSHSLMCLSVLPDARRRHRGE